MTYRAQALGNPSQRKPRIPILQHLDPRVAHTRELDKSDELTFLAVAHPNSAAPSTRWLGLPDILAKPAQDRDRSCVENANSITLWLFNLLLELATKESAVLAENPRNSIMWLTPEAKRLRAVKGMQFTD